jgi:uroporphyrinogen-III decarboxylase
MYSANVHGPFKVRIICIICYFPGALKVMEGCRSNSCTHDGSGTVHSATLMTFNAPATDARIPFWTILMTFKSRGMKVSIEAQKAPHFQRLPSKPNQQ